MWALDVGHRLLSGFSESLSELWAVGETINGSLVVSSRKEIKEWTYEEEK